MAKRHLNFQDEPCSSQQKFPKQETSPLSPANIEIPTSTATVHAIIASLSPIRPSSRYFDGELTDGDSVIRLVGFSKSQREQLEEFCQKRIPITLKNCQIQQNKFKNNLEVVLKTHTSIQPSDVTFDVTNLKTVGSPLTQLSDLHTKDEYSKVTVTVKVLKVHEPQTVSTGKMKQDVVIADTTARSQVTLWESDMNKLEEHKSYQLNRAVVRIYMGKRYLTIPQTGSTIEEISNIEDLDSEEEISDESEDECIISGTITGIQNLETVYACMNCARTVEPTGAAIGICTTCETTQKLTTPRFSARLFIHSQNRDKATPLKAHGDILRSIAQKTQKESITHQDLLYAPAFNCRYNKFKVVTEVTRD